MNWYDDLCEYFGVTKDQAVQLSTRSKGRKPALPAGRVCKAVSNKTLEDIWDEKPRNTVSEKMAFYSDMGAWQTFRQCNYNSVRGAYHKMVAKYLPKNGVFCEYGCGVAPVSTWMVDNGYVPAEIHLVDVPGEHLAFAKWRLEKRIEKMSEKPVLVVYEVPSNDHPMPEFSNNSRFDVVTILDVFEHLPNPLEIIWHIYAYSKKWSILVENWYRGGAPCRENLPEAQNDREMVMGFIKTNYDLKKEDGMRFWTKAK